MIASVGNNIKRKSNEKSTDFSSIDKSTKEDKEISNLKNKTNSPTKKKQKKEAIVADSNSLTSKKQKKRVTWNPVETVNVVSYKKDNLRNTHGEPGFIKEKVKCGCTIF